MKNNWQTKKLGDLYDITSSKRVFKSEWKNAGVPFYRAREIVKLARQGFVENELYISEEMYKKYAEKYGIPKEDDIMVTGVGTLGICYVVRKNDKFYFKDGNIIWLRTKNNVNSRLIEYAFKSDLFRVQINDGKGATVGTYTIIKAKNTVIQLPQLAEQHRIVKILDEVFEKIAKAEENTEKNLQNAKELFESYLQSSFKDNVEQKKLGDKNLVQIIDGDRGKNYPKKSDFHDEDYCLFLNTKNVRPDGFSFETKIFISKKKDEALGNGKLKRNDVLLTTRGTIGNIAVYDENVPFENIRINSGMLIFRPNTKLIIPEYLFAIFQSGIMKSQIKKHVSGAAQPQLPIKTLVNFSILVPKSLSEQRLIVKKLDAISVETRKLEEIYKQKLFDLEELKKSFLQKAFSGEL